MHSSKKILRFKLELCAYGMNEKDVKSIVGISFHRHYIPPTLNPIHKACASERWDGTPLDKNPGTLVDNDN